MASGLTARQLEVLRACADGWPTREIALRLGVSEHTVRSHRRWVLIRLGARTMAGAVAIALREGLIE